MLVSLLTKVDEGGFFKGDEAKRSVRQEAFFSDGSLLYQPAGMKEEGLPVTMIAYQPQASWYLAYISLNMTFLWASSLHSDVR